MCDHESTWHFHSPLVARRLQHLTSDRGLLTSWVTQLFTILLLDLDGSVFYLHFWLDC